MEFDQILEKTGPFGKYQTRVVALLYIASLFSALPVQQDVFVSYSPQYRSVLCPTLHSTGQFCVLLSTVRVSFVSYSPQYRSVLCPTLHSTGQFCVLLSTVQVSFVSYSPQYRCEVPECEDGPDGYEGSFLNFTIPWNEKDSEFESCSKYQFLNSSSKWKVELSDSGQCSDDNFAENTTVDCDGQFIYSDEVFSSSTVIDFTLTCDRALYTPLLGMAYMLGSLVGSILMGGLGDYLGRRLSFLVVVIMFAASGLVGGLCQSFWMLVATRFLTAVGGNGIYQFAFILCVENVIPRHRVPVGILINAPYAVGGAFVALLAYLIRDNWRLLQCLFTVPSLILVTYYWLVPESARWLLSKGRQAEALEIVSYIARVNGHSEDLDAEITKQQDQETLQDPKQKKLAAENKSVWDLLRLPNMRGRCLINFFIWPSVTLVYYGVSLNSVNLGGSVFLNFLLSMVIEIPAYFTVLFTLDRFGRKGTLLASLLLSGIPCFSSGFLPPQSSAAIPLSLVGKFGAAGAFSILYVYASEVFPTSYRSVGVGACSMCARVGGILAPLIAGLGQLYYAPLPLLVFGVLTLDSAMLVLLLPETAGCTLPTTLDESESFGRDQKMLDFLCFQGRDRSRLKEGDETPSTPSSKNGSLQIRI
ncbi:Major facilitator sugar transporter-like [Trinorchestia longiramus]|nr:Major facilitator sugar transporter-like [Trinorchestia longiramus]